MTRTADFTTKTTIDEHDREIPRYTDWRAVIDLVEARQPGWRGRLTVRIEARDGALTDVMPGYDTSYLFEVDIPAHVDSDPCDYLPGVLKILTDEGFRLADRGWTRTEDGIAAATKVAA